MRPYRSIQRARRMRREATIPETKLWRWLRDRYCHDFKFRRQHPLGPFIVDFYCVELKLAVELDGRGHEAGAQMFYDVRRDLELSKLGVTMLRIPNIELLREPEVVWLKIRRAIEEIVGRQLIY